MNQIGLVTKDPIKLLSRVLQSLSGKVRVSLEGQLQDYRLSDYGKVTSSETDSLKRDSSPHDCDFLICEVDDSTKSEFVEYLRNQASHESDLIHVHVEQDGRVVFGATDNFAYNCVYIAEDLGRPMLANLVAEGCISDSFVPPDYPESPFLIEYCAMNPELSNILLERKE